MSTFKVPSLAKACLISIGLVLITPIVAESRAGIPGWKQGGCSDGGCYYYKVIRRDYPFVVAKVKVKDAISRINSPAYRVMDMEQEFNCDNWKSRKRDYASIDSKPYRWMSWEKWKDVNPGTVGEDNLKAVCG